MKTQTYSNRCMRTRSNKTVSFYKKGSITLTGNLAVIIVLSAFTAFAMLLIKLDLMQW